MKKHKVLVIDDEKIIRERLKNLLDLDGYETFIAENGQKGLEIFHKEKPEIALIDVKMPGMDGIEVLKKMREKSMETEVIIITGHGSTDTAINALRGGAFGYIQKPIEYDELEIDIKKALEKQEMQRKLDENVHSLEKAVKEKKRELSLRKKAEVKVRQAAEEWEKTFDSISDLILIRDKDNNVTRVNKIFADVYKLKPGDSIGKKCYEVFCKRSAPGTECPYEKTMKDKKSHIQEHYDPVIGIPFLVTTSPLFDAKGELMGSVHVAKDISKMKEAEEELQAKVRELEKMNRVTMGREFRIAELKEEVARFKEEPASRGL